MRAIWIIFKKEILDNLRDRKAVFSSLQTVFLIPILYVFVFAMTGKKHQVVDDHTIKLSVIGDSYFPDLGVYLKGKGVDLEPIEGQNPEDLIAKDKKRLVLIIPDDFVENYGRNRSPEIRLVYSGKERSVKKDLSKLAQYVGQFGRTIGMQRSMLQGIAPSYLIPFELKVEDLNRSKSDLRFVYALFPGIMVFILFMGGFYLISDMFAGERERHTMEPLMQLPLTVRSIYWGKFLAGLFFSVSSLIAASYLYLGLLQIEFIQSSMGFALEIVWGEVFVSLLLMVPLGLLAVAAQSIICIYSRSNKEAQTYTSILSILAFLPSVFLDFFAEGNEVLIGYIPSVGQVLHISEYMASHSLSLEGMIQVTSITLVLFLALVYLGMRRMKMEAFIR